DHDHEDHDDHEHAREADPRRAAGAVPVRVPLGRPARLAGRPRRRRRGVHRRGRLPRGRSGQLLLGAAQRRDGDAADDARRRGRDHAHHPARGLRRVDAGLHPERRADVHAHAAGAGALDVPRAARPRVGRRAAHLVPAADPPARGARRRDAPHVDDHQRARAAAGPRVALGRPDPRAEQPRRRRAARHRVAAQPRRRHAAQAGHARVRQARQRDRRAARRAAGGRREPGGDRSRALGAGGVGRRGRAGRLARRAQRRWRLGPRAGARRGRPGRRVAGQGRAHGARGLDRGRGALDRLRRRDRDAHGRDHRRHRPHLHPGRRGPAVLAARPRPVPGGRPARPAEVDAGDDEPQVRGHPHRQGDRSRPAEDPGLRRRAQPGLDQPHRQRRGRHAVPRRRHGHPDHPHAPRRPRRRRRDRRHRPRHPRRRAPAHLRAVLHDEGRRRGHRPGAGHLVAHRRQEAPRRHPRAHRSGRHDVRDLPAPGRAGARAGAGGRARGRL
ncbi:MAG: Sensor histidine kinase, partial [uncultured Actinomycetospora sp.]